MSISLLQMNGGYEKKIFMEKKIVEKVKKKITKKL